MFFEIAIVVLLTLINGLLAMSELAIVSARPARMKMLIERGSRGAAIAVALAENPGRFLSSVQIGITLVGVLSGAFSGATLGVRLASALEAAGMAPSTASTLGMGGVVALITYLSLIIGELVPKQIALSEPEAVATKVAPLMKAIATVAAPIVFVLEISGKLVLRALGLSGERNSTMSDEEIRAMISEAESSGALEQGESRMIAGVMRVADRSAHQFMTPRGEVETVPVEISSPELIARFRETRLARLVVMEGDTPLGVVTLGDLLHLAPGADGFDLRRDLTPVPAVHESMSGLEVIEALRSSVVRMLFVFDEYGTFEGTITSLDVLEGITGEFAGPENPEPKVVARKDGSLLVSGAMPADEFADYIGYRIPQGFHVATAAGLVIHLAGDLPQVGESVVVGDWRAEVVDLDGRRIDKLLVARL